MKSFKALVKKSKISGKKSPYDPKFVAMIKKTEKRGNYIEIDPNDVWGSLK